MSPFKSEKVTITAEEGAPEAYAYAQDFASVFRIAGFELIFFAVGAQTTGVNAVMTGGAPVTGVALHPKDEAAWRKPVFQAFDRALDAAKIPHSAQYVGGLQWKETDLEIYIGPKPRD